MGDASEWSTGPGGVGAPPPSGLPGWATSGAAPVAPADGAPPPAPTTLPPVGAPPPATTTLPPVGAIPPLGATRGPGPGPAPTPGPNPDQPRLALPRSNVATLRPLVRTLVLGALALAGAQGSRALPDWEDGRWWLLTAALVVVAVGCGVLGVLMAVSALGEISRHRRVLKGGVACAAGLLLASGLVVAGGIRGAHDWHELDAPAAWDRLELGKTDGRTFADSIDDARAVTAASGEEVRTRGRTDGCYEGDDARPGAEVTCTEPHGMEVLGRITMTGAADPPGDEALHRAGVDQCTGTLRDRVGAEATDDHDLRALVPDEVSWLAGDRNALCVVVFPDPVEGRLGA